jgi:type III secretory pathway component EscT
MVVDKINKPSKRNFEYQLLHCNLYDIIIHTCFYASGNRLSIIENNISNIVIMKVDSNSMIICSD